MVIPFDTKNAPRALIGGRVLIRDNTVLLVGHTTESCFQWNQSIENAGVAFVKGAGERNKFFEKITISNV